MLIFFILFRFMYLPQITTLNTLNFKKKTITTKMNFASICLSHLVCLLGRGTWWWWGQCVCVGGGGAGGEGHRGEARIRTLVVVFLFEDIMVRA